MVEAEDLAVLHVSTERGWRGGERQLYLLAQGLRERGVRVAVAAPEGSPLAARTTELRLPLIPLHGRRPFHPRNVFQILGWLRSNPGAVLHTHSSPALTQASLAKRCTGHSALVHTRRVAFPVRRSRKYRRAADCYVVVSHAIREQLLAVGAPTDRVRVIRSAVDLGEVDAATPEHTLASERATPTVACVAHLSPEKGHVTLLTAWAQLVRSHPTARLVIVGDGPERPWIESTAAGIPQAGIVFTGFCDRVPALLKTCDLYVQPSLSEGIGGAVLEAMACGLPVVASRVGGLPEAVCDGETGLLVPPERPRELAAAMLALLADPGRAAAMGAAGRKRIEDEFTVARMVHAYVEVYRSLG